MTRIGGCPSGRDNGDENNGEGAEGPGGAEGRLELMNGPWDIMWGGGEGQRRRNRFQKARRRQCRRLSGPNSATGSERPSPGTR